MNEIRLTREERTRILEGSNKPLHRDKKPEVEIGHEVVVSRTRPRGWVDDARDAGGDLYIFRPESKPAMWINVTDIVRRTKGGWSVYFRVTDQRQADWYVSRGGQYSRSKINAVDHLAAPVDKQTERRMATEAHLADAERKKRDEHLAERAAKKQERALRSRLRETLAMLPPAAQTRASGRP